MQTKVVLDNKICYGNCIPAGAVLKTLKPEKKNPVRNYE